MGKLPHLKKDSGHLENGAAKKSNPARGSAWDSRGRPNSKARRGSNKVAQSKSSATERQFPALAADVNLDELDRGCRRELMALQKENADWVGKHLVMVGRVMGSNSNLAHRHAQAAFSRAARIPIVRETLGVTAYLVGDYALALRELRTYRRMSGSNEVVPMMIDCERALGRPKKGLELASEVSKQELSANDAVELAIARSGARLDLGELELAMQELELPELNPKSVYSYSPALFDAYASVMSLLGRHKEASRWGDFADRAADALTSKSGFSYEEFEVTDLFWEEND